MNKNGWGLRVELAFLLLFLICLLISTIGLHKMGLVGNNSIGVEEDYSDHLFEELEGRVADAAKKYYSDKYPYGSGDTIVVSVDTLKYHGYLSPIYDKRDNECKGYARILKTGVTVPYIKCTYYKTTGYSEEYE